MKFRGDDKLIDSYTLLYINASVFNSYHTSHNKTVAEFLEVQLKEMFEDKYNYRQIHSKFIHM